MLRICLSFALLLPAVLRAQQQTAVVQEDVVVTESTHDLVCDPFAGHCTVTQLLVATVGARRLKLRMFENKPEALLGLGTYPGQRVPGKTNIPYRVDESYILTYPDGKTEKFEVIGILR